MRSDAGREPLPDPLPCTPQADCAGSTCGAVWDGCGGIVQCGGGCGSGQVCGAELPRSCVAEPCLSANWCWEYPRLNGFRLNDVFALGPQDVWAMGDHGVVLRYDVTSFGPYAVPTGGTELHGVWARDGNDVWIVGERGVVLHYDGTAISRYHGIGDIDPDRGISTLFRVWGSQDGHVFIAGGDPNDDAGHSQRFRSVVYHYDTVDWSLENVSWGGGGYTSLSGTTSRNVWVGPWPLHYDGVGWTRVENPPVKPAALQTWANDDVLAVSEDGAITHWDGAGCDQVDLPGERLDALWGPSSQAVTIAGRADAGPWLPHIWRGGGAVFARADDAAFYARRVAAVHGTADDDIWAVGELGSIRHFDGSGWSLVLGGDAFASSKAWGGAADDLWAWAATAW